MVLQTVFVCGATEFVYNFEIYTGVVIYYTKRYVANVDRVDVKNVAL